MTPSEDTDETPKHRSLNRATSHSKLRRGRRHCPICLGAFRKITTRTRLRKECLACRAHPSKQKVCVKCGASAIWENKHLAACQACGLHGEKGQVIQGLSRRKEGEEK